MRAESFDENEFVAFGNGAREGAQLICPDSKDPHAICELILERAPPSFMSGLFGEGRVFNLMCVENMLCEFSKYRKAMGGKKLKRKYEAVK